MSANVILKAIKAATDNLFDDDFLRPYANQISDAMDNIKFKSGTGADVDVPMDDELNFLMDDIAELETKVFLREKIDKSLEELQQMKQWKNYQEGDWQTFSRARGYSEQEIDDFDRLQKLRDQILDDDGGLSVEIQSILNTLRNEYNKVKVDVDPDKILDKKYAPLVDFYATKILNDGIVIRGNINRSAITKEGARKLARDYVVKMVEELEPEESSIIKKLFSKISLKDESLPEEAVDLATRELNLEEGMSGSIIEIPIFRAYKDFHGFDFDPAFLFPREMGVHIGTQGQAHTIIAAEFRDMPSDWATGQQIERRDMLEFLMKKAKENNMNFAITKGYARIRNPLRLKREPMSWKASEMLTMAGEFLDAIETQSKYLPPDFQKQFDDLTNIGFQIEKKVIDAPPLVSSRFHKYKNEALDASLTADVQRLLNRAGFDAIEYTNEVESTFKGEANKSYILFNPYQFKSVYGKALDFEDPRTAYATGSLVKAGSKILAPAIEGLFSPAEKAALNLPLSKKQLEQGMPGEFYINKLMQTGENVTKDELEFTGFIDAFKDRKNVKLEEVQRFFEENSLDLKEERYNEFKSHSLAKTENERFINPFNEEENNINPFDEEDSDNYYEAVYSLPSRLKGSKYGLIAHFDPGTLAHYRVSKLPEKNTGEKVYVLDELQSDYHQTGRKEGYRKDETKDLDNLKDLYKDEFMSIQEAEFRINDFTSKIDSLNRESLLDPETGSLSSKGKRFFMDFVDGDLAVVQQIKTKLLKKYDNSRLIKELFAEAFNTENPTSDKLTKLYVNADYMPGTARMVKEVTDLYILDLLNKAQQKTFKETIKKDNTKKPIDIFNEQLKEVENKIKSFYSDLEGSIQKIDSDLDIFKAATMNTKPPRAPYEKNWYKFLINKALINAVKEGHNKIALTTSDTQAKRYNTPEYKAKGFRKYYDEIYPKYLKNFGKKYGVDLEETVVVSPNGTETMVRALPITPEMKKDIQQGLPKFSEGGYVDDLRKLFMSGSLVKAGTKIFAPAIDGLFSPAEKAALNLKQKSGTGQSFINAIKKGEGVKEEELQATGFIDAFKNKKKVDLDEVQEFLSSNRYNLRTERADNAFQEYSLLDEEPLSMDTEGQTYANIFKIPEGKKGSNYMPAHFTEGTMAHTRVTALPESKTNKKVYVIEEIQSDLHQQGRNYGYYNPKAEEEYESILEKLEPATKAIADNLQETKKINDRIKSLLNIEDFEDLEDGLDEFEILKQDTEGYINYLRRELNASEYFYAIEDIFDDVDKFFSIEELIEETTQLLNNYFEPGEQVDILEKDFIIESVGDLFFNINRYKILQNFENLVESTPHTKVFEVIENYFNNLKNSINKNEQNLNKRIKEETGQEYKNIEKLKNQTTYGVPDVPYKKDWYKLALRKSLIDAVDQDFDKVGLTTAKIQAERYGYEGDKAKGFVKYYDEIYPKFLKEFGKKYNANVELTKVKTPSGREFEIWAMDLTPEMKKDIKTGLPKFAEGGYVVESGDSLSKIAEKLNTNVEDLARLNNIEDVNKIFVGQRLKTQEAKPVSAKEKQQSILDRFSGFDFAKQLVKGFFRTGEQTEENFSDKLKENLRVAAQNALNDGRTSIDYKDYPTLSTGETMDDWVKGRRGDSSVSSWASKMLFEPSFNTAMTLGRANITKGEDGNIYIEDEYDFSKINKEYKELGLYGKFRKLMGDIFPTEGNKIKINLGKEEELFGVSVNQGDTLSKIANDYSVDLNKLAQYNNIADPNKIFIGQRIKIPTAEMLASAETNRNFKTS